MVNKDTGLEHSDLKSLTLIHGGPLTAAIAIYPLKNGKVYVELLGTERIQIPTLQEKKDEIQKPSK